MKISKVADIVEGEVVFVGRGQAMAPELVGILTNLPPVERPRGPIGWTVNIEIGQGASARVVAMQLSPLVSESDPLDKPLCIDSRGLVYFRDRLFMSERPPKTAGELEEVALRVKKAVYDEDTDLASVRAAVANLEAVVQLSKSGVRRDPIPEDVKLLVWTRDGGACVRCGSKQDLHFDHIIPVSKGGGSSDANIQILCQACNLRKADKISCT